MDTYASRPAAAFSGMARPAYAGADGSLFRGVLAYLVAGFALVLLIRVHPNFSFLLVPAALWSVHRRNALQLGLLAFMTVLTISNSLFFPRTILFVTAVRLSFGFIALGNLLFLLSHQGPPPFRQLKLLFGFLIISVFSSIVGWNPLISFLKLFLFTVFQIAVFGAGAGLAQSRIPVDKFRSITFFLIAYVVYGSVALVPFPNIGHSMILDRWTHMDAEGLLMQEITLFNGVTWHSQTLGPLLAILNAYVFAELLRKPGEHRFFYLATLAIIPGLIFYTDSRTGLLSYIISLIATFVWQGFIRNRKLIEEKQRRGILLILLLLGPIYLFSLGGLLQMQNFLLKGTRDAESVTEALQMSRLGLAEYSLKHFINSPIIGNGFQVAENMRAYGYQDLALAASAPIEKGVLPTMVLEETGIVGFAFFMVFIFAVLRSALHFGCLRFLASFTTFIALNSGEATFFSVTGPGGLYWTICILALVIDWKERAPELVHG